MIGFTLSAATVETLHVWLEGDSKEDKAKRTEDANRQEEAEKDADARKPPSKSTDHDVTTVN